MSCTDIMMEFIPELVGAFFGAFLGFLLGMRQERLSRKEEEKNVKNSIVQSIIQEHIQNSKTLELEQKTIKYLGEEVLALEMHFLTASFDSAIYSGKFSSLHPKRQLLIQSFYSSLKMLNESTKTIYQYRSPEVVLIKLKAYEGVYEALRDTKDGVLRTLQEELI